MKTSSHIDYKSSILRQPDIGGWLGFYEFYKDTEGRVLDVTVGFIKCDAVLGVELMSGDLKLILKTKRPGLITIDLAEVHSAFMCQDEEEGTRKAEDRLNEYIRRVFGALKLYPQPDVYAA